MKNTFKRLSCLILVLTITVCSAGVSQAGITSNSGNGILIDQITGNVLYSKNAYEKAYPASTTKLMTAIVYYEKFANNLNKGVTVTQAMMNQLPSGSSTMLLEVDEVVTREQLLYGLMLVSGNDAAIVMAYDHSGSMEGFVAEMNKKAKEFGMDSTHFVNSHGFHDPEHYTTAADFAILARQYMRYDELKKIAGTSKYAMAATNKKEAYTMFNSNRLISAKEQYKDFVYSKATGIKTGFTNSAKNCFIGSATDGQMGLIWVGFGYETTEERFTEAEKIFEYAFKNFTTAGIYKYIKDTELYVDATSFKVPQYEYGNVDAMVYINAKENVYIDKGIASNLDNSYVYAKFSPLLDVEYPIKDGDFIGYVEYYANDSLIYTAKAYSTKYVEDRDVPAIVDTAIANKGSKTTTFLERAMNIGLNAKNSGQTNNNTQNSMNNSETTNTTETTTAVSESTKTNSTSSTKKSTASSSKKSSTSSSKKASSGSTRSSGTSSTKKAS